MFGAAFGSSPKYGGTSGSLVSASLSAGISCPPLASSSSFFHHLGGMCYHNHLELGAHCDFCLQRAGPVMPFLVMTSDGPRQSLH